MTHARRRKSVLPEGEPDRQDRVNEYLRQIHTAHGIGPNGKRKLLPAYRALLAIGVGIRRGVIEAQEAQA